MDRGYFLTNFAERWVSRYQRGYQNS